MKTKKTFLLLAVASTLVLSACNSNTTSSSNSVSSSLSNSTSSVVSNSSSSSSSSSSVHVHSYGVWTITKEPTLTEKGEASRKCKDDDTQEKVEIAALSDETVWTKTEVSAPTHLTKGLDRYTSIYGSVDVETDKTAEHIGSGKYTAVKKDDGTVELVEKCVADDGYVGDAKKTMTAKCGAEYTIDTSRSNPFTNTEGTSTWTSAAIGDSSASYLVLDVTKAGTLKISIKISSEKFDKLHIQSNLSSNKFDETYAGDGTDAYVEYTFEKDVLEDQQILIYYSKDSSGVKGADQAIITLEDSTYEYHAVTYDVNGGDSVDPSFIENGKILGDLPTPTKEKSYFEGWFIDSDLTTAYDASTFTADGDVTLYAKYSDALYVRLHKDNGEEIESVPFQKGTKPTIPSTNPTKDGYYFIGWYTDSDYTTEYVDAVANDSFDLYAKWISESDANPLYGSYKGFYVETGSSSSDGSGWGGSSSSFSSPTIGSNYCDVEIDVSGNISLKYAYSGYETAKVGTIGDKGDVTITDNTKITVAYKDGDTLIIAYKYSSSKTRYYFVSKSNTENSKTGVTCASVNSYKNIFVSYKVGDVDKTAYIDATSGFSVYADISFVDVKGKTISVSSISSSYVFKVRDGDTTIASFYATTTSGTYKTTSDGYEGTYTSNDGNTLTLSGAGKVQTSLWGSSASSNSYEVLTDDTIYINYGSIYRYIVKLDKTNNTFTYAERTADVTFDFNYCEGDSTETKKEIVSALYDATEWFTSHTDKYEDIIAPTRTGYTFDGWYDNPSFTGSKVEKVCIKDNITLYAKWIKNCTVSFAEADGTSINGCDAIEITGGKTLTTIPEPSKDGVYFDGWYTDNTLTTQFDSTSAITQDMTLYAKWTNPVTITMYYNNTTENTPITQQAQVNRVPTISEPTKDGCVFDGWYTDKELTTPFDSTAKLTGDVTLYAKWKDASKFMGSYYGYNCYGTTNKTGSFTSSGSYNIKVDGYGVVTGKFNDYTITSFDSSTGTITFTKTDGKVGYGKYLKADDGRIFIMTYYSGPYTTFPKDIDFLVLNTNSSEKLSYEQSKSDNVFTVKVSVDGTLTYTINIDTSAGTFTFAE